MKHSPFLNALTDAGIIFTQTSQDSPDQYKTFYEYRVSKDQTTHLIIVEDTTSSGYRVFIEDNKNEIYVDVKTILDIIAPKIKKFEIPVGWDTNESGDDVSLFSFEISEDEEKRYKSLQQKVKEDKDIFSIKCWFGGELLDEDKDESNFRHDGLELIIYDDSFVIKTQSKYDSTCEIESESFKLN